MEADVLQLLLSKEARKKANAFISFENDTISIFGDAQKLFLTTSGHYALPIGFQCGQFSSELGEDQATEPVFITAEFCDKNKTATKLHTCRQFSHPKAERVINLLKVLGTLMKLYFKPLKNWTHHVKAVSDVVDLVIISLLLGYQWQCPSMNVLQWTKRIP